MYFRIDENKRVVVKVFGKAAEALKPDNVTTFKTDTEPEIGAGDVLHYNPETAEFYTEKIAEPTEEAKERAKARAAAQKQRADALQWLADNDWKINKRTLGEWEETDERWLAYLADRAAARAKIDEAEAVLNG